MSNKLAIANISGVAAPAAPGLSAVGGIDRNAVRIYEREKLIRYTLTLTGNYVQHVRGSNVGEVLDLTAVLGNTTYFPDQFWGYKGPVRGYVLNAGGTGYSMSIVPGADALHWLLCIFSGVATELIAGGYPAGLLTDTDIILEFSGFAFD